MTIMFHTSKYQKFIIIVENYVYLSKITKNVFNQINKYQKTCYMSVILQLIHTSKNNIYLINFLKL